MRSLYAFETGHCTDTKVTTVTGPRSEANCTGAPPRSRRAKSSTFEPTLKSCPRRTAAPRAAVNSSTFIVPSGRRSEPRPLLLEFEIDHRTVAGIEHAECLD